jgi:hypothetical protein
VLVGSLHDLCGEKSSVKIVKKLDEMEMDSTRAESTGTVIEVEVDGKSAQIDPRTLQIGNCSDQLFNHLLSSITQKVAHSILPI